MIRYSLYHYEAPEALQRFVGYPEGAPCPPEDMPAHLLSFYSSQVCIPISTGDFDSLYETLRSRGFDKVRTRPVELIPHQAGALFKLSWGDVQCEIGDVVHAVEVAEADKATFNACRDAIHDVMYDAQRRPTLEGETARDID